METILEQLAQSARERVQKNKELKPPAEIRAEAEAAAQSEADEGIDRAGLLPFERALAQDGISFICEVKKASPSKGLIAGDFDYMRIAREYEEAGAAAISVLTEPARFCGSDEYLRRIAGEATIPVLRKDFTVDSYMIYEAKVLGASAVLLICAILTETELAEYLEICRRLNLAALVEAHTETEISMNPVFHYGYEEFFAKCEELGVDGIISPELPYEERGEMLPFAAKHNVDMITMVAPTSEERIKMIAGEATGFVYIVSSMGVTGVRSDITTDIGAIVEHVRAVTDTPAAIGFGISTPEQAAEMAGIADGVIVGSAIVKIIEKYGSEAAPELEKYVRSMKAAVASADED